jgi:hypothetical protein
MQRQVKNVEVGCNDLHDLAHSPRREFTDKALGE